MTEITSKLTQGYQYGTAKSEVVRSHRRNETFDGDESRADVYLLQSPTSLKLDQTEADLSTLPKLLPEKYILSPYDLSEEFLTAIRHRGMVNDLSIALLSGFTILLAYSWYFYFEEYNPAYSDYLKWIIIANNGLTILLIYLRYSLEYDVLVKKKYVVKKGTHICMTSLNTKMLIEMLIAAVFFPPFASLTLTLENDYERVDYEFDHIILILILLRVYQIPRALKNLGRFTTNRSARMAWLSGFELNFQYVIKLYYHDAPMKFTATFSLIFVFWLGCATDILEPNSSLEMEDSTLEKFWLMIATLTSLGYGEISVVTTLARVVLVIGAIVGNVISVMLVVVGLEHFTLRGPQLDAFNKLMLFIRHDNRTRQLANPAARLIQAKLRIYRWRCHKPGTTPPPIFERLSLNSQLLRDVQRFKHHRQQLPVSVSEGVRDHVKEMQEKQFQSIAEVTDKIRSLRRTSNWLYDYKKQTMQQKELTDQIKDNAILLSKIMKSKSPNIRNIQLAQLKNKLQDICKISTQTSREPEAEQSDSDALSKAKSVEQSQFFQPEPPKAHISKLKKETGTKIKKFMKKNQKDAVENFAYDW